MSPYFYPRIILYQIITALLLFITFASIYSTVNADKNQNKAENNAYRNAYHLGWIDKTGRFDFIFRTEGNIKSLVKLESDAEDFLSSSLENCTNHSACLFRNGSYLESFSVDNQKTHESVYTSFNTSIRSSGRITSHSDKCDTGNKLKILHYCSTHWNPPVHLNRFDCDHLIEWHSPLTCHSNTTNQEYPCYIYNRQGKLLDLTRWILSNGTSYLVDVEGTKIKKFNLNICNEAHDSCGPNVSACLVDQHSNVVESGYNNLTSIKYDLKDHAVLLTYLGQFKKQCNDSRLKTVIRFICKNKVISHTGPRLVKSSSCENIVEWPSIHACPVADISASATECRIRHEGFGIDVDIKRLANNQTIVEVPGLNFDGKDKRMILGICQAIPKNFTCEGKQNSNTKACLVDANDNSTIKSASNSMIVGSVMKSSIRLSDEKIYLESYAINRTCSETVYKDFNVTRQVGTRIEFICSPNYQTRPTFLAYDDCTYVFQWETPFLCLEEDMLRNTNSSRTYTNGSYFNSTSPYEKSKVKKSQDLVKTTKLKLENTSKLATPVVPDAKPAKMNNAHKIFMISLIVMSFAAFIVAIFVLDKKTRLRVTIRQARQAFQGNQQPYSRVVNDLDL